MTKRPDDDPTEHNDSEKPEDTSRSQEESDRDQRVRGGFFQSDADAKKPDGDKKRPDRSQGEKSSRPGRRSGEEAGRDGVASGPGSLFNLGGLASSGIFGSPRSGGAGSKGARPGSGAGKGPRRPSGPRSGSARASKPGPLAWTIGILVVGAILISLLAGTWTEVLWFNQLGFSRVIWTQWIASGVLFVIGFLIVFVAMLGSMVSAYRARHIEVPRDDESFRNLESYRTSVEPVRRLLTWGVPVVVALATSALRLAPNWRELLLAIHSQSFGIKDPQFGLDVSFFVFILPALRVTLSFLTNVIVLCGLASAAVHYLYGGIAVSRNPHFTREARRHLALFLAGYSLLHGVGYWLHRYEVLFASSTKFDGASYTDVNAVIPADAILAAISAVIAVMFLVSVRSSSWKLPVTGVAVMIVSALLIGSAYPAVIQKFVVDPNAQREEAAYIDRNIKATRTAYGLDGVEVTAYDARTTAEAGQLKEDAESTASIRLLDPNIVSPSFRQFQVIKQYYSFSPALNVDRYAIDGDSRDTVVAVREMNLSGLDSGQRTWINEHTVFTHGYGVITAYGNTVTSSGTPAFWEGGIPSSGDLGEYEPRIYFGQSSPSYSIVGGNDGGEPRELDYPDDASDNGQVNTTFAGNGGPDVSNPINRLLYAVKFREMNILFSQEVRDGAQILYDRDPATRVSKVAPWLTLDGSAYPAVVDDDDDPATPKRVVWILDGYTTTNNFPYSQHNSLQDSAADATDTNGLVGAPDEVNYVRNSVKAVVDAYDGSVTLYEWDEGDPILNAWKEIFPGSVTPMSAMSADLMAHMRYPEDLFKVQRHVLTQYHVTSAADFYSGGDFWKVPDDPTKEGAGAQAPYYLTLKMPDQDQASFSLSSVFIIGGNTDRNVLTGFLAVDSETNSGEPGVRAPGYGQLRLLELPRSSNVSGPGQVQNQFNSNDAAQVLNLLSQQGSQVIKGNLLTLPVGGGLLYVQPVYVQSSSGTQYPLLRKVLVSFGDKVGFADSLSEALDLVFGGDSGATTGEQVVDGDSASANDTSDASATEAPEDPTATEVPSAGTEATSTPNPAPSAPASPAPSAAPADGDPQTRLNTALQDAQTAINDSDTALKNGDWAAYGDAQNRLTDALNRALAAEQEISNGG